MLMDQDAFSFFSASVFTFFAGAFLAAGFFFSVVALGAALAFGLSSVFFAAVLGAAFGLGFAAVGSFLVVFLAAWALGLAVVVFFLVTSLASTGATFLGAAFMAGLGLGLGFVRASFSLRLFLFRFSWIRRRFCLLLLLPIHFLLEVRWSVFACCRMMRKVCKCNDFKGENQLKTGVF